jgi:hypothetical protein
MSPKYRPELERAEISMVPCSWSPATVFVASTQINNFSFEHLQDTDGSGSNLMFDEGDIDTDELNSG